MQENFWRKCASCKKEINFNAIYQVCSVSTCKKHVYCSVTCWDVHVPIMNHKSAWAQEERSPTKDAYQREMASTSMPRAPERRIVTSTTSTNKTSDENSDDVLIVASKLKQYVKNKHDLNTSAEVMDALSDIVRRATDTAAQNAKRDGRKTLMSRDF